MASRTFDEMDRMFEQMDRMFEDMRSRWGGSGRGDYSLGGPTHDWQETEDAHTLVVDLPGFEKDELDLNARTGEGVVVIDAEHEVKGETEVHHRHVHERFSLPDGADAEGASASYRNGVLEVSFPRIESVESGHRIDIE